MLISFLFCDVGMSDVPLSLEERLKINPIIQKGKDSGYLRSVVGKRFDPQFIHVSAKYSLADSKVALDQLLAQEKEDRAISPSILSLTRLFCDVVGCEDDPEELVKYITDLNNWTSLWFVNTFGEIAREVSELNPVTFYHDLGPKKMLSNTQYTQAGLFGKFFGANALFRQIKKSSRNLTTISEFDYENLDVKRKKEIKERIDFPPGLNGTMLRVTRTRLPEVLALSKEVYCEDLSLAISYDILRTEGVLLYGASALGDFGHVLKAPEESNETQAVFYAAFPTLKEKLSSLFRHPRNLGNYLFNQASAFVFAYPLLKKLSLELEDNKRQITEHAADLAAAEQRAREAEDALRNLDLGGFRHDAISSVRDGWRLHKKTVFSVVSSHLFTAYQRAREGNQDYLRYVTTIDEGLDLWFLEEDQITQKELEETLFVTIAEKSGRMTKSYEEVQKLHRQTVTTLEGTISGEAQEFVRKIFSPLNALQEHRRLKTARIADFSSRGKEDGAYSVISLQDLLTQVESVAQNKLSGKWNLSTQHSTNYEIVVKNSRVFVDTIYDILKNSIEAGATEIVLEGANFLAFPYLGEYRDILSQGGRMPETYISIRDNGPGHPYPKETTQEINDPTLKATNRSTRAAEDAGGEGTENLRQLINTEFHKDKLKGLYHVTQNKENSGTEVYLFFYSQELHTLK